MTRVKRTIRPIGQGAFYTERLHTKSGIFNIVYDCGLECIPNPPKKLKEKIDDYIDEIGSDGLNMIFISHFHYDHINGIKYLLDKANLSNPKIVMPLIDEELGIVYFVENLIGYYTNGDNIALDRETISFYQRLLFRNDDQFIRINNENETRYISPNITSNNSPKEEDWLYIPVVCIDKELNEFARTVLIELKKTNSEISDILKKGAVDEISRLDWIEIFKAIKKVRNKKEFKRANLNNMSLMLYSGFDRPMNVFENKHSDYYCDRCCDYYHCRRYSCYHDRCTFPGALYTGDMEKEDAWNTLEKHLFQPHPFSKKLVLFQISHHGHGYGKSSDHDNTFNLNTTDVIRPDLAFCCYGSKNRYHHPGYRLLKQYYEYDVPSICIDENTKPFIQIISR